MFGLGPTELIVILLILLLLFGANKVPELMRSLGSGVKEFKAGVEEAKRDAEESTTVADAGESKY